MEGIRERYERYLRQREDKKLEDVRAKFWTKIDAVINDSKSYK